MEDIKLQVVRDQGQKLGLDFGFIARLIEKWGKPVAHFLLKLLEGSPEIAERSDSVESLLVNMLTTYRGQLVDLADQELNAALDFLIKRLQPCSKPGA